MEAKEVFFMLVRYIFRILFSVAAFVLLIFFLIPMFMGIKDIANIMGAVFCSLYLLWANNVFFFSLIKMQIKKYKVGRVILNIIYGLIILGLVYAVALSGCMINAMVKAPAENSTVIVLGCKVDGKNPSVMLTKRLESAQKYLTVNLNAKCILSGGQGSNEIISEAECMYNYLTSKGIDKNCLYIEDKSTDTDENIRFSKEIIKSNGLSSSLAIVTDGFHELRASIIAGKNGLNDVGAVSADTPFYLIPTYWVREWLAVPVEIIK